MKRHKNDSREPEFEYDVSEEYTESELRDYINF